MKEKKSKFKSTSIFLKIVNKVLQIGGIFFFLIFFTFLAYYFLSGLNYKFTPKNLFLKINTVFFDKYLGVDFLKFEDYFEITKLKIKYLIVKPNVEILRLEVNQKNVLDLEKQRKSKIDKNLKKTKYLKDNILINYKDKKFKGRIRVKGDRAIHWLNRKTTSFKIDLQGDDRMFGLEKFSLQKPIVRNYTYEYLFHKLLSYTNHLSLKYFFINLYFNDENRGLYVVEEGISKELIERNKKRNGPIFGLDELTSLNYPNVQYDLYSSNFWIKENPNLIKTAFSILNNIKDNEKNINIQDYFDMDKWASFFAIVDITGSYHGSISKSVKLYFNPVTAKFEPIGFDGHYGIGNLKNFILSDFLQEGKISCSFLCDERNWYLKFFKAKNGELNHTFIDRYIHYLKQYSNQDFINKFLKLNNKDINIINSLIYSENSKADKGLWKGMATFIYNKNLLYDRAKLIKSRMNSINFSNYKLSLDENTLVFKDSFSKFPILLTKLNCKTDNKILFYFAGNMTIDWPKICNQISLKNSDDERKTYILEENLSMSKSKIPKQINNFKKLSNNKGVNKVSENNFEVSNDLNISKNTHIEKTQNFLIKNNVKLELNNGALLYVEGNIVFEGTRENKISIKSDGTGSIIFNNNHVRIEHTEVNNLGHPKLDQFILYGGLNFINANVVLKNVSIQNSKSEDALNLINSKTYLKNISLKNIQSDAIDIDFGTMNFTKIICLNVKNDCLDLSGAKTDGSILNVDSVNDKGLSAGENSEVNIIDLIMENSRLAVAVKDGSNVYLENIKSVNNDYDIALFNKKNEYSEPFLKIKNFSKKNKKILQSNNSKLTIDEKFFLGGQSNEYINSILY